MSDVYPSVEELPVLSRLALSYAPKVAREKTLGLLALDARLAGIVRSASEPMLAQLRLAWWRDQFAKPISDWPEGEPLLATLKAWREQARALGGLVDGWEHLAGEGPLPANDFSALASARGDAFGALAILLGADYAREECKVAGREWALADLLSRVSAPEETVALRELAGKAAFGPIRLPRAMRPLALLHGLARKAMDSGLSLDDLPPSALLKALRIGLVGR